MIKKFEQYISLNEKVYFEKVKEIDPLNVNRCFQDMNQFKIGHWFRIKRGILTKVGNRDVFLETYSNIIELAKALNDWGHCSLHYNREFRNGRIKTIVLDDPFPYTYKASFHFYDSEIGNRVRIEELKKIRIDNGTNLEMDPYREEDWDDD